MPRRRAGRPTRPRFAHVGVRVVHWGVYGQNILLSAREEMQRPRWLEGPRISSKLQTLIATIHELDIAIADAARFEYDDLVTEGRDWRAILTAGREGVAAYVR